jgi:hypothetical protein
MTADRYTKTVLAVIAVALIAIAARPWLPEAGPWLPEAGWTSVVHPRVAQAQTTTPKYEVTVPKAWGKFVSFSNNNLLLESPDGTLRVVDVEGKAPEFPKIKALIHWQ